MRVLIVPGDAPSPEAPGAEASHACKPVAGFSRRSRRWQLLLLCGLFLAGLGTGGARLVAGSILREVFSGISGTGLANLTNAPGFPNNPSSTNLLTSFFEAPENVADNYGQRVHGYLVPPVRGSYRFWIASDDASELRLSTNDSPAGGVRIAWVTNYTSSRQWTKEARQQSSLITLQSNTVYYIEALQKEGTGSDHLAVRWLRPDGVDEGPIPATYLLPWGTVFTAPQIVQQPAHTTAVEGETAFFQVAVSNPDPVICQWRKNGTNVAGASHTNLVYGPVLLSEDGARFSAWLTNRLGTATSSNAVLRVVPDTNRPTLTIARNHGLTVLEVVFSEPVDPGTATNAVNYRLSDGVTVGGAQTNADPRSILLAVSSLVHGTTYTLTVSNVTDRAVARNPILPGSRIDFTAREFWWGEVGAPAIPGSTVPVSGGFDVTGAGTTIGGTNDQFHLGYRLRAGDFDVRARLTGVTITDPFVRAGLMARESMAPNARFAAVFGSSPQLGCYFSSRGTTGGTATNLPAPHAHFRVNYPWTWLRLRRVGGAFYGFASLDGVTWTQLGTANLGSLPSTLYFGLGVCSDNAREAATAGFRDIGDTAGGVTGLQETPVEPPGPSSRYTGLTFSEIMYHPAPRVDGRNLEFVELYNARAVFEDLSGWRLSGDIDYGFPDGFRLEAGATVVVAAVPDDLRAVYGLTNVLGPYTNALANGGGRLRLRNHAGAIRLEVEWSDNSRWPAAADGAGHSLVLARPSLGENVAEAWAASWYRGGSPGQVDPVVPRPLDAVCINEFLAHTDLPQVDAVELFNNSREEADLSGCWLTEDPATNRFRIPDGTRLGPFGFVFFTPAQLGFALAASGETLYLVDPAGTRVIDAVRFGAQENGVASGRCPDGAGTIRRLAAPTLGLPNAVRRLEPVVFSEINYHPLPEDDGDEYVELYNRGTAPVDLEGWRLGDGIDYTFSSPTVLGAGSYLVVARDAARLASRHPQLETNNLRGDFTGALANRGERLTLQRPDTVVETNAFGRVVTNLLHITVAEVTYGTGGRWPRLADGGGSSLELVDPQADGLEGSSWAASDESAKAPWSEFRFSGVLGNGFAGFGPDHLFVLMQGEGECLVDDVAVLDPSGVNLLADPGFEGGGAGWSFFGNHSRSQVQAAGAYGGTQCLRVRASGDGDTAPNTIRVPLAAGLTNGVTASFVARVRWLSGWPEILFRLRGDYLDMPVRMVLPSNLGTPGLPNSRRVANAGPAITDVRHAPLLPATNQPVVVTCRVADADDVALVSLLYRVDPSTAATTLTMRDDGLAPDVRAGDGVYATQIPAQATTNLVAFRVQAQDDAASPAVSVFPAGYPEQEGLVRWGEPVRWGSLAHYHLWSTAATEAARSVASGGLDNTWRDATLVYGGFRLLYNVAFRDKGSPFHQGRGDFVVAAPADSLLLGTTERVFGSTGNNNSEVTGTRSQLAAWFGQQLGIPYLHAHYMQLYRNGSPYRNLTEDLQQPDQEFAERWFTDGVPGDLYKISKWFEFQTNNTTHSSQHASIERFTDSTGALKPGRYRWSFQRRVNDGLANNLTQLLELVETANGAGVQYVPQLLAAADVAQWMRCFAYNFGMGNWDSWSYNVGQNLYLFKPAGDRWVLLPWDLDFTFGLGDGPTTRLWGGHEAVINRLNAIPDFQRMLWQAHLEAAEDIFLPEQYSSQIAARYTVLLKNGVTGLSATNAIYDFLSQRRAYILNQVALSNAPAFAITSNGGTDFTSPAPAVTLAGAAPLAVATIEVNGVPYPLSWTDLHAFTVRLPLAQGTNTLQLVGRDARGRPVAGAADSIRVVYAGVPPRAEHFVAFNEIHYHPLQSGAGFLEIQNRSTDTPFDLSGWRIEGVGYTFPPGSVMRPDSYLLLVANRSDFAAAYGGGVPVFDEFPGTLDNGGEWLSLVRPGAAPAADTVVSRLRYEDRLPWPVEADGLGPSLQRVDPAQGAEWVGNWAAVPTNAAVLATPGAANDVRLVQTLPPFPELWINEVLPGNVSGARDAAGDRDPWVELFNRGTDTLDLSGLYLSPGATQLTAWSFPAGTRLPAGQFLVVWADGEPAETTAGELHTSFRLNPTNGTVLLARLQGGASQPAALDVAEYLLLSPDRSLGAIPDGDPRGRRLLHYPTPGASNNPASPVLRVTINEIMAANANTLADPVDGDYEDWFELYNAGTNSVDLTAYTLADNVTNASRFEIPPGTVLAPGGFLLVWADSEPGQNSATNGAVHVDFKLDAAGEQIALFAPDGALVDGLSFGPQTNDVSVGRYPDGATTPLTVLDRATPQAANYLTGTNYPPSLAPVVDRTVAEQATLIVDPVASDPDTNQVLTFSVDAGAPAGVAIDPSNGRITWTPSEAEGPGLFPITIRVTDNGTPARSATQLFQVSVTEANRAPGFGVLADRVVDEGALATWRLAAADPDLPTNAVTYALEPGAPLGATLDPATGTFRWTPAEAQAPGVYPVGVRVTDNGVPPLSDFATFQITVNEVPNPPEIDPLQAVTLPELSPLQVQVRAVDPDTPPSPLTFSLSQAPAGAQIDPVTGWIRWTPGEAEGPTNAWFVVRATEDAPPGFSASTTLSVQVLESNQPPVLAPPADVVVSEGDTVTFRAAAGDADLPAQRLTFSLLSGAPAGAQVDPVSGVFLWTTPAEGGLRTNGIRLRVEDDGPGVLAATQAFTVVLLPRFRGVINEIMHQPAVSQAAYVELLNTATATPQDLSGLVLRSRDLTFTFPTGTLLAPQALLCVAADPAVFLATYGSRIACVGPWTGTLAAPDTLELVSVGPPETVLDRVFFDRAAPWPAVPGASLQLVDAAQDNDRAGNWSVGSGYSGPRQLVTLTNRWRYYQNSNTPPASAWATPGFVDSAWPEGQALLYVEGSDLGLPKRTPLQLGSRAYYFRARFDLASVPADATLNLGLVIDDGALFWLNGVELFRTNLPAGAVGFTTLAVSNVGNAALRGPIALPATRLQPGENVLAVEVHQDKTNSTDIVMGCSLELEAGLAAGYTPGAPNSVTAVLSAFPTLRLNEVVTRNRSGLTDRVGDRDPWIEIVNTGASSVSLEGLYLTDDPAILTKWAFPAESSIPAGGFLLVFADAEPGEGIPAEPHAGFRLPSAAGTPWWLALTRFQGIAAGVVDSLAGQVMGDDVAVGRYPDAEPASVMALAAPTPAAPNQAPTEFMLGWVQVAAGRFEFSWNSLPGRTYRVEYQEVLGEPSWTPLLQVQASGTALTCSDPLTGGARYYRVVLLP